MKINKLLESKKVDDYITIKEINRLKDNPGESINKTHYSVSYNNYIDANTNEPMGGHFTVIENKGKDQTRVDDVKELKDYIVRRYGKYFTEDVSHEWKPNTSFKPIKENYWIDNKEVMDKVDKLEKQLDLEGWKSYADRYSGSAYYSIFVNRINDEAVAKAVVYNHSIEPHIIDITIDQAIGKDPIDSFEGMRKKLGKMLMPQNESVSSKVDYKSFIKEIVPSKHRLSSIEPVYGFDSTQYLATHIEPNDDVINDIIYYIKEGVIWLIQM